MVTIRIRSMVWFATGVVLALIASLLVMQAWRVDAAPGDTDTTFVSITSCRLADTRFPPDRVGPNDKWGPEETKTLQATGANGECTIPSEAVGLSLKVFALNATVGGFVTIWGEGDLPLGSALNPSTSGIVFSAATTPLSSTGSFKVFNKIGDVDLIIDVNGYYTKSSLTELHGNRVIAASNKKDDVTDPAAGSYGVAMSVSVEAHSVGIIQIVGSALVLAPTSEGNFDCRITRGPGATENTGSSNDLSDTDRRLNVPMNREGFCSTNGTVAVGAGTHVINLVVRKDQATSLIDDGTLQAIFIPGGILDNTDG